MNPLAPEVHDFYLAYADAMLKEFGDQLDALVWDETAWSATTPTVPWKSPAIHPRDDAAGARSRRQSGNTRPQDGPAHLGLRGRLGRADYAMVAHGTYQDTWCQPAAWPCGIFPNWRNTLWSCCWWPVHKWKWIEFGVKNYQAPVAISNGWGDNTGLCRNVAGEATESPRTFPLAGTIQGANEINGQIARLQE